MHRKLVNFKHSSVFVRLDAAAYSILLYSVHYQILPVLLKCVQLIENRHLPIERRLIKTNLNYKVSLIHFENMNILSFRPKTQQLTAQKTSTNDGLVEPIFYHLFVMALQRVWPKLGCLSCTGNCGRCGRWHLPGRVRRENSSHRRCPELKLAWGQGPIFATFQNCVQAYLATFKYSFKEVRTTQMQA